MSTDVATTHYLTQRPSVEEAMNRHNKRTHILRVFRFGFKHLTVVFISKHNYKKEETMKDDVYAQCILLYIRGQKGQIPSSFAEMLKH